MQECSHHHVSILVHTRLDTHLTAHTNTHTRHKYAQISLYISTYVRTIHKTSLIITCHHKSLHTFPYVHTMQKASLITTCALFKHIHVHSTSAYTRMRLGNDCTSCVYMWMDPGTYECTQCGKVRQEGSQKAHCCGVLLPLRPCPVFLLSNCDDSS